MIFILAFIPLYKVERTGGAGCLKMLSIGLIHLVLLQAILGIVTLVMNVPVALGVLHQGLGIALFVYCLYFIFALRGQRYGRT